mgnify:CR=1 FL=1
MATITPFHDRPVMWWDPNKVKCIQHSMKLVESNGRLVTTMYTASVTWRVNVPVSIAVPEPMSANNFIFCIDSRRNRQQRKDQHLESTGVDVVIQLAD